MNHPRPEEWIPYLHGETKPEARRQLKSHLETCQDCREELAAWQRALGRLDSWKLPRAHSAVEWFGPVLKWAAAAALVLSIGFGIGRLSATRADAEKLRAQIQAQLSSQLTQMFHQELQAANATTLAAANSQTEKQLAAYQAADEARRADDLRTVYLSLKKQLDTVAVNTEQQLVQLVSYAEPGNRPASP